MSERQRPEFSASTADATRVARPSLSGVASAGPLPGVRIDPAHSLDPGAPQRGDELLLQASQMAEHLRQQFAELDRREQAVSEQAALIDQERRTVRLWIQQSEEDVLEQTESLKSREAELNHRIATCERLVRELEDQEHLLQAARTELDAERRRMREDVGREVDVDRNALEQVRRVFEAEKREFETRVEAHHREHERALESVRRTLEAERMKLREEIMADLRIAQAEFDQQRNEWRAQREAEAAAIQREREISETAFRRTEDEIEGLRQQQGVILERERLHHEQQVRQEREAFDAELECKREEFKRWQEDQRSTIERQRAEHERQMAIERESVEREIESRVREADQNRALLDSRLRFQQEHLQKVRRDLEDEQRQLLSEHQRTRADLERRIRILMLQRSQLDHYRSLLESREESIRREQDLLQKSRGAFADECQRDRQRTRGEREAWEQERDAQQAELRRQRDMLALHAENLEGRRERLDQLRAELEETHRESLELRMAVEDAWVQLAQGAGEETARRRVDEAREAISRHYQQIRANLSEQRRELADAQIALQQKRDEFARERQLLTDWIAERDEKLRLWEEQLSREGEALEIRGNGWRAAGERWLQEKVEAERVIRSLLAQLTQVAGDAEAPEQAARWFASNESTAAGDEL